MAQAQSRYEALRMDRQPFLDRGREAAAYTIPHLLPPEGHSSHDSFDDTYQSMGARGVNTLASKMLMALMPPNQPFFRLIVTEHELAKMNSADQRAQVEEALASVERTVLDVAEKRALRITIFEAIKHLIVSGNVMLYVNPKGKSKMWHLDSFVTKRDGEGNVVEAVACDEISGATIPEDVQEEAELDLKPDETYNLYTHVKRTEKGNWVSYEEIKGVTVPDSEGEYKDGKCPFLFPRWSAVSGESYGRGYVEEYIGDLKSLDGLSKSIVEGAAGAAKTLFLVSSGGQTRIKDIAEAPNLAVRKGNAEEVTVLRTDKVNDMNFALQTSETLQQRLAHAFMLTEVVQRDAERVTAHEIRTMAQQLENALGGVYSIMSQELQHPLAEVLMHQLQRENKIPSLPDDTVEPKVIAGMEALGRGHDLDRLTSLIEQAANLGPEVFSRYVNVGDYLTRLATSLGIDASGLIRSEQEVQQMQQQQREQQAMANAMEQTAVEESRTSAGQQAQSAAVPQEGQSPMSPQQ